MSELRVAWWNLENLFDHENAARPDSLKDEIGHELAGWTAGLRDRKLDQLASVLVQLFAGQGPDLLGVCEVESESVLQLLVDRLDAHLPNRSYRISHHDSTDARGIDTSLVFDQKLLSRKENDCSTRPASRTTSPSRCGCSIEPPGGWRPPPQPPPAARTQPTWSKPGRQPAPSSLRVSTV